MLFDFGVGPASYGGGQDRRGATAASVEANGQSLRLDGNTWKKFDLSDAAATIEVGSVLRVTLDLEGAALGKIHAIGLDSDDIYYGSNEAIFQLAGTDPYSRFSQDYAGQITADGGPVTYEIDLSAWAGQSFSDLVVINDDDKNRGAVSIWSDVSIGRIGDTSVPTPQPEPEPNRAPTTAEVDAGSIGEGAAPRSIDLLANAADADGDTLSVRDVTVTDDLGRAVAFELDGTDLRIDPGQFADELFAGDRREISIAYDVIDVRGGSAAGSATLEVEGTGDTYISGDPGGYNVEVVFNGTWTAELRAGFIEAAEAVSDIVIGDIEDTTDRNGVPIDDIRITATLANIDGVGGTLGSAGPSSVRFPDYLPDEGRMTFDAADAQSLLNRGTWVDVIFHEMLHTLGFGTIWQVLGLVEDIGGGDLRFTGENAIAAYETSFPEIFAADEFAFRGVPVETDGGPGTAGGHWDEAAFGNEILTGYINRTNELSDMTIASLEDLGYETIWDGSLLG
jgi:hypothetical protein